MGDEPLKPEENPFASPREVSPLIFANDRYGDHRKLGCLSSVIITVLVLVAMVIAFGFSCTYLTPDQPRNSPPGLFLIGAPIATALAGGITYWCLSRLVFWFTRAKPSNHGLKSPTDVIHDDTDRLSRKSEERPSDK